MTLSELQAERDKILKALSMPHSLTAGDKSVTRQTSVELRESLAVVDSEIARLQGSTGRTFVIQSDRGI